MLTMADDIKLATTMWTQSDQGDANQLCQQAELAESLGFHSFWLPENHFVEQGSTPSPLTLLAAVAARTSTIKLATTSYLITIRNPLQAAEEVAVLDHLSSGRLILGLGRGMQSSMFTAFDVPANKKRERFKNNLDLMRKAWAGKPIAHDGNGQAIVLNPLPYQRPHPPLWLAAFGRLALSQAATLGLPYIASPLETLATLESNYQHYHTEMAEHDHAPIKTIPVMRTVFVSDQAARVDQLKAALQKSKRRYQSDDGADIDDWAIIGSESFVRDKLNEYIDRLALNHIIARGRLPGVDDKEQVNSHERLLRLVSEL